jgi:hypothetical protein
MPYYLHSYTYAQSIFCVPAQRGAWQELTGTNGRADSNNSAVTARAVAASRAGKFQWKLACHGTSHNIRSTLAQSIQKGPAAVHPTISRQTAASGQTAGPGGPGAVERTAGRRLAQRRASLPARATRTRIQVGLGEFGKHFH